MHYPELPKSTRSRVERVTHPAGTAAADGRERQIDELLPSSGCDTIVTMPLPLLGVLKTCPACQGTFACGADTGSCWCAELPATLPVPTDLKVGCLCPTCLRERIAEAEAGREALTDGVNNGHPEGA